MDKSLDYRLERHRARVIGRWSMRLLLRHATKSVSHATVAAITPSPNAYPALSVLRVHKPTQVAFAQAPSRFRLWRRRLANPKLAGPRTGARLP